VKVLVQREGFDQYLSRLREEWSDSLRFEREVRSILEDVRHRGDEAVVHYTRTFDGLRIPIHQLQVNRSEVREAYKKVPRNFLGTLKKANRAFEISPTSE